jgi:hypothetical protein
VNHLPVGTVTFLFTDVEILVSPTTESVVEGLDLYGVELRALPERRLEDFDRHVVLYEAVGRS